MKPSKILAAAAVLFLSVGMSGIIAGPAFADDATPPTDTAVAETVAAAPAAESGPAPAPEAAPAPAADPAPDAPADATDSPASDAPADSESTDSASTDSAPADNPPTDSAPADPTTDDSGAPATDVDALAPVTSLTAATIVKRVTAAGSLANVTLCHATQGINPWIVETIDEQAAFFGHVDPPNNKNDHLTDIIPAFSYKDHGVVTFYAGRNLDTLFGGIPGSQILANNCDVPTTVTPAAVATAQSCPSGFTLVAGQIQLTMITGVTYTITGPGGVVSYDANGLASPVAPGNYSVAFVLSGPGYFTTVTSPILVTVAAFTGPCSRTVVTPAASANPETCAVVAPALVDGSIQLTLITGVTYTIKDSSNTVINYDATGLSDPVPPGDYTVSFVVDPAYTTAVVSPITVTVDPFVGACGNLTQVNPGASVAPQTCSRLGALVDGAIQLTVIAGVTYTITDAANAVVNYDASGLSDPVAPGTYSISFQLAVGLGSSKTNPFTVIVPAYAGVCVPPSPVTPAAVPTDQTCVGFVFLTDGHIQLAVTSGVTYTITGPGGNVPFNLAGITGPIAPATYQVGYVLDPGYTSAVANPFPVTVSAYPGLCDLTTFPLVTPALVKVQLSCVGDGSYTLSNDLSDPLALTWKANGSTVSEGLHTVSGPTTITVVATANAPSYGLTPGSQSSWTLKFARPASCDLETLALTGSSPWVGGVLALTMIAAGLGLFQMRSARRRDPIA